MHGFMRPRRDQAIEAGVERVGVVVIVEQHPPRAEKAGEDEDDRVPPRRTRRSRGEIDRQRPHVRVAEGVTAERAARTSSRTTRPLLFARGIGRMLHGPDGEGAGRMAAAPAATSPGVLWPRWLFLRALGLVFLSAFDSLAYQIHGLIGHEGILPAGQYLALVAKAMPGLRASGTRRRSSGSARATRRSRRSSSSGRVASALLVLNVWPRASIAVAWLSLPVVHRRRAGVRVVPVRRDAARGGLPLALLRAARAPARARRGAPAVAGEPVPAASGSGSASTSSRAS